MRDAAELWTAVLGRNRDADGTFVYAVRSTRVFCRPSCPSRRPARIRVEFFATPEEARARGYRDCRRCHPGRELAGTPSTGRVQRICAAIRSAPERRWTSRELAMIGHCSAVHVRRSFRSALGLSPRDYVAFARRRALLDRIRGGRAVTAAIYEAGYGSSSRAYAADVLPGMTLSTYGKGGAGATISWATIDSPIGRILVASTARGLCFVEVGASMGELVAQLGREFPLASIDVEPSVTLDPLLRAALRMAEGQAPADAVPLDIRGTAFQWRVWRALQRIPLGETRTYSELAQLIGAPRSVRAVARACACNPVALLVPCHRVVGADGRLRGFRWGVDVKGKLIEAEREGLKQHKA